MDHEIQPDTLSRLSSSEGFFSERRPLPAVFSHYASVARYALRISIQSQLENPLSLVSWLLIIPIRYFSGIAVLYVLTERFQTLAGWSFAELAFLYGLSLLSHGLQVILFNQTWQIDGLVNRGSFDRMLVRPMDIFFQFATRSINIIGVIDLLPGTIIFLYGAQHVGFGWSPANIGRLALVLVGAVLIRTAIYMFAGSVAFWTRRSFPLVMLCMFLLEQGSFYPLSFYPYTLQVVLTWLIPTGLVAFYPASELLGKPTPLDLPVSSILWTPLVGVLLFWLAYRVFRRGVRRYESAGS